MTRLSLVRPGILSAASAIALLTAVPAHGQDLLGIDTSGNWYIQGGGGLNWANDQDITFAGGTNSTGYDLGWLAGGAVGYAWNNGLRTELEGVYRSNDVDGPAGRITDGYADSAGIMFNILYDIDTGSAITPYLGGGVGAGYVDYSFTIPGFGTYTDDTWGVALQAIAGASYAVTDSIDIFTDYRYYTVLGSDVNGTVGPNATAISVDDDYSSHAVFFGARYHFLPPPPPPPAPTPVEPPPPPPPAQDRFIVFFDWDRSNLTPQANGVLDDVVATYNQAGFAQVLAEAHTDTSGPAGYNVGLSQRRGESVRQGLIARGIAPDEIVVRAFGETQLLVPTPDGVREPQNRRVEIILM
ncbi:MAG: outer membrane beta-barrel protein [Azospirillaceae bacterium]